WIELTQGGIPSSTAGNDQINFYNEDYQRRFIKIPNDPSQPNCKKLFDMLEVIDKYNDDSPRKIIATQDGHKLGLTIDQLSTI
ncbi:hypothetical protein IIB34_04295, partial [PVC group bacterium]|nr:hypothetical protein [PVC group bacterium]